MKVPGYVNSYYQPPYDDDTVDFSGEGVEYSGSLTDEYATDQFSTEDSLQATTNTDESFNRDVTYY